ETSPLIPVNSKNAPYARAKLAAFYEGMARAARGKDVNFVIPGGIYGPSPFAERALVPSIFTGTLLMAARGELRRYLPMPISWVLASDVAEVSLRALERGSAGRRYLALGCPQDTQSLPAFCNRFLKMAGIEHLVDEVDLADPRTADDAEFGSMIKMVQPSYPTPSHDPSRTIAALGVEPTLLEDGLRRTLDWM